MPSTSTERPWALTRATSFAEPAGETALVAAAIDPDTQLTVYRDADGRILQAGPPSTVRPGRL